MMIPMSDVAQSNLSVKDELHAAMDTTMQRGDFILGRAVGTFETEFATFIGRKHCVGNASGTSSLELAFRALGLTEGDEVIIQSNSYIATAFALSGTGCTLVLVDCDETGAIDVNKIADKLTPKTKAIVVVHLFGNMPDMDALKGLNVPIIEDCAQAHGSTYRGIKAGAWGVAACYSFYPGKNLGCLGDGGAVVTDDDDLARRLRLMGNLGKSSKYSHDIMATNSRLDTLQAAFLSVKLPHLEGWNAQRRQWSASYDSAIQQMGCPVWPVPVTSDCVSCRHLYVVRTEHRDLRDHIVDYLNGHDVQSLIHYPIPFYRSKSYIEDGGLKTVRFTATDTVISDVMSETVFSLPLFPEMTAEQQLKVLSELKAAMTAWSKRIAE